MQAPTPSQALFFDVNHPLYLQLINGHAIRLLELSPGRANDPIRITLSIHELEYAPPFDAISYVWGDARQRRNIFCNTKLLSVTKSLEAAFRRIRLSDKPRLVWADAICINQGDTREKSHHVAFMCDVYRRARDVLICMGDDKHGVGNDVSDLIEEHRIRSEPYKMMKEMPVLEDGHETLRDKRWKSVARFLEVPWWSRAWVIQEAGVAKNPVVLFGDVEFSYRLLTRLLRWIVNKASQLQTRAGISVSTIHTDWEEWSDGWSKVQDYPYTVVDFLSHAKGLGCQEPRDHIYAFLGHPLLRKDNNSSPVIPSDYSIATASVFRRLTEWLIQNVGLFALTAIEHDQETIQDNATPSWVIRWDMDIIQNSLGYYRPFTYNASKLDDRNNIGGEAVIRHEDDIQDGCISLSAGSAHAVVAVHQFSTLEEDWTVEDAAPALERTGKLRAILNAIRESVADATTPCSYESEARDDALSLTLVTGLRDWDPAHKDLDAHHKDRDAFWDLLARSKESPEPATAILDPPQVESVDDEDQESSETMASRYYYNLSLACKGRCFFITDTGYWGMGPWILQAGDQIRIVEGLRVPMALRAVTDPESSESDERKREDIKPGNPSFRLLGECYMHGVMYGEAIGDDQTWTQLVIR